MTDDQLIEVVAWAMTKYARTRRAHSRKALSNIDLGIMLRREVEIRGLTGQVLTRYMQSAPYRRPHEKTRRIKIEG